MSNINEKIRRKRMYPLERTRHYLERINELNLKHQNTLFWFDKNYLPMNDYNSIQTEEKSFSSTIIRYSKLSNHSEFSKFTMSEQQAYIDWCYCNDLLKYFPYVLNKEERLAIEYRYFKDVLPQDYTKEEIYNICRNRSRYFRLVKRAEEIVCELKYMDVYYPDGISYKGKDICYAERQQRTGIWGGYVSGEHPEWELLFLPDAQEAKIHFEKFYHLRE